MARRHATALEHFLKRGWLSIVALGLTGAHGQLTVLDGPREVIGLQLLAAPYQFSSPVFDVEAPAVLANPEDWDTTGCPPVYRGRASLRGAVVVTMRPNMGACSSQEQHALGVARAGGAAWVIMVPAMLSTDQPGLCAKCWNFGDSRTLAFPAADISQRASEPFAAALRNGASLRVRLRPSRTTWYDVRASPVLAIFRTIVAVQSAAVIEAASLHLFAIIRDDGGPRFVLRQIALGLTIACGLCRLVIFVVDPLFTTGVLDRPTSSMLVSLCISLGSVASSLLLVWFGASSSAFQDVRLTRKAQLLLASSTIAALAIDVLMAIWLYFTLNTLIKIIKITLTIVAIPLCITLLSVATLFRVRASPMKAELPAVLFQRLERRIRAFMWLNFACFLVGCLTYLMFGTPWVALPGFTALALASNCTSFVVVAAFRPITGEVLIGPLGWCAQKLKNAMCCWSSAKLSHPSKLPRKPESSKSATPASAALSPVASCNSFSVATSSGTKARHGLLRFLTQKRSSKVCAIESVAAAGAEDEGLFGCQVFDADGKPLAPRLLLGVSIAFLRSWSAEVSIRKDETTADVSQRLVAPLGATSEGRSSVFSFLARRTPAGAPAVGRATLFVSHAQQCSFMRLLEALEAHVALHSLNPSQAFAWLDLFCLNQADIASELPHIGMILRAIGQVVLVIEPWSRPKCLTRVWVLFELVQAVQSDGRWNAPVLHLTMPPAERAAFLRALRDNRAVVEQAMVAFNAEQAESSLEADRTRIFELIRSLGGFDTFNERVREALRRALAAWSWQL